MLLWGLLLLLMRVKLVGLLIKLNLSGMPNCDTSSRNGVNDHRRRRRNELSGKSGNSRFFYRRIEFLRIIERSEVRQIKEVRLVDASGNAIVSAEEAWRKAEEQELDLVLVSDESTVPPVVRIQDYKKIMFEKKKARAAVSDLGSNTATRR